MTAASSTPLRFALFGAGFWANYQLAGWNEIAGAQCIAICDPDRARAELLALRYGVPTIATDPAEALATPGLNFIDICAPPHAHRALAEAAATRGLHIVCQKPLAPTLEDATAIVAAADSAGVRLFVNENWRWQAPFRALRAVLDGGAVGAPFRARLTFSTSFPVFDNQPFLATLPQFILADVGVHVLDAARYLFGEATSLRATTRRVNPAIAGEDVATVLLTMGDNVTVTCELSYATRWEHERFPFTYVFVEGTLGSVAFGPEDWLRVTTAAGTHASRVTLPRYPWAEPAYDLVHGSIVAAQDNILTGLLGGAAETTGHDNLRTLRLVFGAYTSAEQGVLLSQDAL